MTVPPQLVNAIADRYRIERELGRGGMATVHLAHDLKHDRKVALKVLKPELAAVIGAERFLVEIKTTANLQHPHILPLFDSGSADGFLYYVMPYVEGDTLRGKLDRERQLDVDESVRLIHDVADALDYAHRQGVIHRDIKPENILVHDGRPVVADFGIALAVTAAGSGRMTETGLSLGTPHYMSPEQATADRDISARSDIYSLACVLYEMLAGEPPHVGPSPQAVLMRILTDTPRAVNEARAAVPPHVAAALAKALEKLPADRFSSAKAFGEALVTEGFTYAARTPGRGMTAATSSTSARAAAGTRRALMAVSGVALLALGAAAWGWLRPAPTQPPMRFDLTLGGADVVVSQDIAISPDGSMLAYATLSTGKQGPGIYLRHLDGEPDFRLLAGTERGVTPDFSPDNRWIVFKRLTDGAIAKVSVNGGGVSTILVSNTAFNPQWGTDDRIVFTGPPGSFIIPATGGEAVPLTGLRGRKIFLLPDGSGVLGTSGAGVAVYDLRTDSITVLVPGGTHPVYASSGHLLYVAEGSGLFAVPFDLKRHRVTGQPVRVLDRVASAPATRGFAISHNGTLVQQDGAGSAGTLAANKLVIYGFAGGADTLPLPVGRRLGPRFSPDGRYVAYYVFNTQRAGRHSDIYTFDLVTGTNTPLTFADVNYSPIWSPDGRRIVYAKRISDSSAKLYVKSADNSGAEERLLDAPGYHIPTGWPRDDLILVNFGVGTQADLGTLSPKAGATEKPYLSAPWPERGMTLSPDGRYAAFVAQETDESNIWLRDFPVPNGKWRVSPGGGRSPRWSPDGRYIYYLASGEVDTLLRAQVDHTPSVVVRAPQVMRVLDVDGGGSWDLHPDGKRFIVATADGAPAAGGAAGDRPTRYIVIQDWFTELRANVKPGKR